MDVKTVGSFYYENFVSTSRKIKQVKKATVEHTRLSDTLQPILETKNKFNNICNTLCIRQ